MSLAKPRGPLARGFKLVPDDKLLATMKGSLWRGGAAGSADQLARQSLRGA